MACDIMVSNNRGFTLVEIVVYVGVLGILVLALSDLTLSTLKNYKLAKIKEDLATSADTVLGAFFQETRQAKKVYLPTSILGSDLGELSLVTNFQPTDKTEPSTYVDLYLAGGQVWLKRENESPQALTPSQLEVTQFKLVRSLPTPGWEGLRLYLSIKSRNQPNEKISLTTFALLKGGYIQ